MSNQIGYIHPNHRATIQHIHLLTEQLSTLSKSMTYEMNRLTAYIAEEEPVVPDADLEKAISRLSPKFAILKEEIETLENDYIKHIGTFNEVMSSSVQ